MHKAVGLITAIVLLAWPLAASVPTAHADLNDVAKALGASSVKSIQYTGIGGVRGRAERRAGAAVAGVQRQEPHALGELRHGVAARRAGAHAGAGSSPLRWRTAHPRRAASELQH